jgi:uncharacterized protein YciI
MFIVMLTYTKPVDVIDSHLSAHRDFLRRNYEAGLFLLSGRKEPRTGGIILVNTESVEDLDAALAQDPFHKYEVAEYTIIRFTATMAAPLPESLLPG